METAIKQYEYVFARARFILPMNPELENGYNTRIEDGYVLCNEKIIECGHYTAEIGTRIKTEYPTVHVMGANDEEDFPMLDGVLMPGFIVAHGHDHESPIVGLAKDVPLTAWLDGAVNVFTGMLNEKKEELSEMFSGSPHYVAYIKARLDNIQYGVTSCCVHHCNHNKYNVEPIVRANVKAGTKMIVAVGSQDRHYDPRILDTPEEAVARMDSYQEQFANTPRTEVIPGPDQLFSNGPEILKALKEWSEKHGKMFHCHSSEEPNTTKWFTEEYGMTPVEYAHSIGILNERTVFAHQVNSTEHDIDLLRENKVKLVHNPLANTVLGSGMPDIINWRKNGIPTAISTDGSGSADCQNILGAAKCAVQYQRALHCDPSVLTAVDVLAMITRAPADFYNFNAGTLEAGRDGDFVLIDLTRPNLTPTLIDTVMENLVWCSDGSEVKHVVANGIVLKEDFEFKTLNEKKIKEDVLELTRYLHAYKRTAAEIRGTGAHK
ncbi:hypothetical protein PCE1_004811 [Barthelona sp. PCE]